MNDGSSPASDGTPLEDMVKQVLTEARVVLPGVQALMGFQFIMMLTQSFDRLPLSSKYVHLCSLGCIVLSIVLLMTPPVYHRIVERGEDTREFHDFASRMVVASMVPLALAFSGDSYVVVEKVIHSSTISLAIAVIVLTLFLGLWFGFTLYKKIMNRGTRENKVFQAV